MGTCFASKKLKVSSIFPSFSEKSIFYQQSNHLVLIISCGSGNQFDRGDAQYSIDAGRFQSIFPQSQWITKILLTIPEFYHKENREQILKLMRMHLSNGDNLNNEINTWFPCFQHASLPICLKEEIHKIQNEFDYVVIQFANHSQRKQGLLVGTENKKKIIFHYADFVQSIKGLLNNFKTTKLILFIDACYTSKILEQIQASIDVNTQKRISFIGNSLSAYSWQAKNDFQHSSPLGSFLSLLLFNAIAQYKKNSQNSIQNYFQENAKTIYFSSIAGLLKGTLLKKYSKLTNDEYKEQSQLISTMKFNEYFITSNFHLLEILIRGQQNPFTQLNEISFDEIRPFTPFSHKKYSSSVSESPTKYEQYETINDLIEDFYDTIAKKFNIKGSYLQALVNYAKKKEINNYQKIEEDSETLCDEMGDELDKHFQTIPDYGVPIIAAFQKKLEEQNNISEC